ncbi:MAG: tetraacyldisaccharide 4'-kinase [Acidobacteriaceae bacterium]|nr:tetraacyldisaccharide 4'-kinase [Acidobacteriaceae bacterium]MBV9503278.1 tetraacyldisaccharide 4'-kinase [Acidobacteriaceae bacterium]
MSVNAAITAANAILEITKPVFGITRAILFYRFLQLVSLPFVFFYFAARLLAKRHYRSRFRERMGSLPRRFTRTKPGSIWLHAVSVGEVASALPLIQALRTALPLVPIYLSTSTVAGRNAAHRQTSGLVEGVFYAPLDYASCVRRTLHAIRPALLVVFETEIWPNLFFETKRTGAKLAIVNGRISNRTWPRYRQWRRFFAPVVRLPDLLFVQGATDKARYLVLGAQPASIETAGNLKYDAAALPPETDIRTFGAEHVWIAASTVGPNERGSFEKHYVNEDEIVIEAFRALAGQFPKLLLILAPRQPARFDQVARLLERTQVSFIRRSAMRSGAVAQLHLPGVLLLDTMGELAGAYRRCTVAFVGGSLAPRGGHNVIEPAASGLPVVVGPHMHNFEAITQDFLESQALIQIRSPSELQSAIAGLLSDPACAANIGNRARQVVRSARGASVLIANRLVKLYHAATVKPQLSMLADCLLRPLALLWREGGYLKRKRAEAASALVLPLPAPVISIGGITVGGSGKTPFTTYLAERLLERNYAPAILTRGYKRQTPARSLVFAPGAKVPSAFTGDEAQIFLRSGLVPVGIGEDRYSTAQILLRQFPDIGVLLLDDGFQHARLLRDFDIVVIDGLDPFGREELVPIGRLREPLTALARAHAFVVTRSENDVRFAAIAERLRTYNPAAPVFRTRLVTRSWRDYSTGRHIPSMDGRRLGAFCGLGNPESFWRTLESLGLDVVFRWTFPDHHLYKPFELQRLAHQAMIQGAEILVTTEKDRINCPGHLEKAIAPLELAWLEIGLEVEDETRFLDLLETALRRCSSGKVAS